MCFDDFLTLLSIVPVDCRNAHGTHPSLSSSDMRQKFVRFFLARMWKKEVKKKRKFKCNEIKKNLKSFHPEQLNQLVELYKLRFSAWELFWEIFLDKFRKEENFAIKKLSQKCVWSFRCNLIIIFMLIIFLRTSSTYSKKIMKQFNFMPKIFLITF